MFFLKGNKHTTFCDDDSDLIGQDRTRSAKVREECYPIMQGARIAAKRGNVTRSVQGEQHSKRQLLKSPNSLRRLIYVLNQLRVDNQQSLKKKYI